MECALSLPVISEIFHAVRAQIVIQMRRQTPSHSSRTKIHMCGTFKRQLSEIESHISQHHAFADDRQGFKHCNSTSRISTASGERSKDCSRNKFTQGSTGIVFPTLSIDKRVPHFLGETYRVCNDRVT